MRSLMYKSVKMCVAMEAASVESEGLRWSWTRDDCEGGGAMAQVDYWRLERSVHLESIVERKDEASAAT